MGVLRIIVWALLLTLVEAHGFCAPSPNTIVVLGSSTAAGVGASTYQTSWVGLLTSALASKGYIVQNVSISGTNTGDSLARFDRDVTPNNPAFVVLATSIVNEPTDTAAQSYLAKTLLLIHKVESIGAIPVVVPPYPNDGFSASMYSSIQNIYTTLGAEGVPLLDFLDAADDGQGHWVAGLSLDGT
ncbi:MAG TPA: SGNH/GDSL hydrolase family protein, partial [Bryobacteraceae bacterium]|nr:SGNH/GDSL hydrolase family protein [Bryobacteraceae bacterium]